MILACVNVRRHTLFTIVVVQLACVRFCNSFVYMDSIKSLFTSQGQIMILLTRSLPDMFNGTSIQGY